MIGKIILTDNLSETRAYHFDPIRYQARVDYKSDTLTSEVAKLIRPSSNSIDGHWLIVVSPIINGAIQPYTEIVGIAHNKTEALDKTYRYALKEAKRQARERGARFINRSWRAKESQLAEKTKQADLLPPSLDACKTPAEVERLSLVYGILSAVRCGEGNIPESYKKQVLSNA